MPCPEKTRPKKKCQDPTKVKKWYFFWFFTKKHRTIGCKVITQLQTYNFSKTKKLTINTTTYLCGAVFCPFCELPSYFLLSSHLCLSPPYMILNCLKEAGLLDGFSPISVGSNASTTENPSKSKKRKVSGKPPMRILSPRQTTPRQKLSLSSQPSNKSKIVIRIHQCGKLGVQLEPFTHAQQNIFQKSRSTHDRITYETIDDDEIRKNRWSPQQVINRLF